MAKNDVELKIYARDQSQKPLKAVTKAINDMAAAQEEQRKAAERGEISTRDLESAYKRLESAGSQLLKLNSIIEVFKRQNIAMTEAVAKTEALRQKQQELQAAYNSSSTVTAKQEKELARVNRQVEAAAKAQENQANRVRRATADMEKYGISTKNVGAAQSSIVSSVSQVNSVLERQDKIIENAATAAAQAKIINGLKQQADQALATAKGYQTLGRVVQVATGQLGPLGTQIQAIVSPAEAARSTLHGLETQVKGVTTELAKNSKEVANVAQKIRDLNAANRTVSGLAQQIDLFRQQVAALRGMRTEYNNAKAAVVELANKMRTATTDTGELGRQMQAAQQRLAAAAQELRRTGDAARSTQSALRAAGIDTRNLADAENRLINASKQSTTALNTLTTATERNSKATRDGGKAFSFFRDEGRTTLSMIQRIRGEVIGLTTAYVGFQGALNLAGGAIDAFKMRQQAMMKIGVVVGGDQKKINEEWEYMNNLADRLGIKLENVAQGYTKFAVSAKGIGFSMEETKYVYEAMAKAGRVYHLSADDMNGVFKAMEQMVSKGQVYAEELRGQLAERLPGAVALMAEATGKSVQDLTKAMENGEIKGREIINFAREQGKAIDAQLAQAVKGVDAVEARASNAMNRFKLAIADSGFVNAYVEMLNKLTDFISSPQGKEAAEKLGQAFTAVAEAVMWAAENVDIIVDILTIFAGLKVAQMVLGLVGSIRALIPVLVSMGTMGTNIIAVMTTFGTRMVAAGGAAGVLGVALKGLARAIPIVGWALMAYSIAEIFYEQSSEFRKEVDLVIRDFKHLGNQLIAIGQTFPAAIYDMTVSIVRPITTMFADTTQSIMNWIADVLEMIPGVGKGLGEWARSIADDLTKDQRDYFESTGKLWDDVDKKWKKLNDDMVAENAKAATQIIQQTAEAAAKMLDPNYATGKANDRPGMKDTKLGDESFVSQRDRDLQALTKDMEKLETAAKKADVAARKAAERKNLKGRLALIDEEFAPQYARAKSIGGKEGDEMTKRIDAVVASRKKAEETLYASQQRTTAGTKKQENAVDSLLRKYEQLNAAVGVKEAKIDPNATFDDRLEAKLKAVNSQYDQLIAKANKIKQPKLANDFEELRQRNLEYATTQAKLEELKRLEDEMNTRQQTKANLLDVINTKREAGMITEAEAIQQTKDLYAEMNQGINDSALALENFANRFKASMSEEEFSRLMAQIQKVQAETLKLTGTFGMMDQAMVDGALGVLETGLRSIHDELVQVAIGAESIGDAFTNLGVTVAKFFADFLMKIAMAILQQQLLNMLAGVSGGVGAVASSMGGVAKKHNGGVIGSKTASGQQRSGGVSPALFANAPRFHSGGLPGLKSDEVPTILQKGEEVLSKDDPDNILNGGRQGGGGTTQPLNARFVLVDDRSRVAEAMNTPEGEIAIMQVLKNNLPTVKQLVK